MKDTARIVIKRLIAESQKCYLSGLRSVGMEQVSRVNIEHSLPYLLAPPSMNMLEKLETSQWDEERLFMDNPHNSSQTVIALVTCHNEKDYPIFAITDNADAKSRMNIPFHKSPGIRHDGEYKAMMARSMQVLNNLNCHEKLEQCKRGDRLCIPKHINAMDVGNFKISPCDTKAAIIIDPELMPGCYYKQSSPNCPQRIRSHGTLDLGTGRTSDYGYIHPHNPRTISHKFHVLVNNKEDEYILRELFYGRKKSTESQYFSKTGIIDYVSKHPLKIYLTDSEKGAMYSVIETIHGFNISKVSQEEIDVEAEQIAYRQKLAEQTLKKEEEQKILQQKEKLLNKTSVIAKTKNPKQIEKLKKLIEQNKSTKTTDEL